MRFHCCPPEKKGALATPKKGGTVGRSSGAGKGLRGSKGKAKSKNPMADVECEDEIEEEIARAFAETISLDGAGGNGESPPTSPVSDPSAGPPRFCQDAPEALKARTLIILDWDDTLLTTTRLTSRHSVFGPGGAPNPPLTNARLHFEYTHVT